MPGLSHDFADAETNPGAIREPQMLIAVIPPSGSRCLPTMGSEAIASLAASM